MTLRKISKIRQGILIVLLAGEFVLLGADYDFDGQISRKVLENYLSRAVTHCGLCSSSADPTTKCLDDDIRMLTNIGAKFVGRSAFAWNLPKSEEAHYSQAKAHSAKVHKADPHIILQACVFEIVTKDIEKIPVPAWVFEAFALHVEKRTFRYKSMLYDKEHRHNQWGDEASVPDMSKLESRLWFYYRARRYIDCGMEAIHFGQVMIMNDNDPGHRNWLDLLGRIRIYAHKHARRHLVLCDAHTHGEVEDGKLLFDFHSFPIRFKEVADKPTQAQMTMHHIESIYGHSKGGLTPSGWSCNSLPYLVEFDNWGYTGRGGQHIDGIWVWGYDEISWFAHQKEAARNEWLHYAWNWVRKHDPNAHLQMPTRRLLAAPLDGRYMFQGNTLSKACPGGFNTEETIKAIWLTALAK